MKKNKILFLLIILFILTGCTAEYNLTIDNDMFTESIDIIVDNDDTYNIQRLTEGSQYISSSSTNDLIYNKTISSEFDVTKFNYSHSFSYDEFRGTLKTKCFDNLKLTESDGIYSLHASGFNCLGEHEDAAESYKINIKTNNKVINNNADEINNNIYTWNIDKSNYEKKSLTLQYEKIESKIPTTNIIYPYIISIIISILFVVSYFVYKRFKMNN